MNRPRLAALICLPLTFSSALAFSQEDPTESAPDDTAEEGVDLGEEDATEGEDLHQDTQEGQSLEPPVAGESGADLELAPPKLLLGVRYRILVVPQFLINAFGVEGGNTIWVHGGGPEVGYADKNFEIIGSAWFAGYSLESTPFKGPNDGPEAWEIIDSTLSMAYITADFLWKKPVAKKWDFVIGAGAGVGITFGGFSRTEAYWSDALGNPIPPPVGGDPYTGLRKCTGPFNPDATGFQCPPDGNYGTGEAWPVYPWLTFQTGLRYSPVRQVVTRLDLGVGSSGFWFGLGVDYGL